MRREKSAGIFGRSRRISHADGLSLANVMNVIEVFFERVRFIVCFFVLSSMDDRLPHLRTDLTSEKKKERKEEAEEKDSVLHYT